jgi:hypothetical protein
MYERAGVMKKFNGIIREICGNTLGPRAAPTPVAQKKDMQQINKADNFVSQMETK